MTDTAVIAGKVLPRLRRKGSRLSGSKKSEDLENGGDSVSSFSSSVSMSMSLDDGEEATDYVFRIVSAFRPEKLRECPLLFSLVNVSLYAEAFMNLTVYRFYRVISNSSTLCFNMWQNTDHCELYIMTHNYPIQRMPS